MGFNSGFKGLILFITSLPQNYLHFSLSSYVKYIITVVGYSVSYNYKLPAVQWNVFFTMCFLSPFYVLLSSFLSFLLFSFFLPFFLLPILLQLMLILIQILKNRFICTKFLIFLGNIQNEHEQVDFETAISLTGEYFFLTRYYPAQYYSNVAYAPVVFLNYLKCFQILKMKL